MSQAPQTIRTNNKLLLLLVFVLSGFAGLIYQSVWSQYLGLFLGHAAYAQALVLAIFMGGMAIGALIISNYGENQKNLIQKYAVIEAIIGVFGLLFHFIFNFFVGLSYDVLIPATDSSFLISVIRWSVASILIIPQTILLGMTFPLMSGGLIRRFPNQDGSLLGGLYFTNSIGAAFGALLSTFVLLPKFGLMGATIVAGVLNILVAVFAFLLSYRPEPNISNVSTHINKQDTHINLKNSSLLRVVLFGTALSGAASFAYEIIWIRMLSMAVGSTLHAFELMLTSFIAGIAFGGLWVRKKADKTQVPLKFVGFMQIAMGLAALFSLLVYSHSFDWVGWLMQALTKTESGYGLYTFGTAMIAILIMMPAAFFAGTTLPLFTVALLRHNHGEKAIGQVYASNTLGSIFGVFLTIYCLIPFLGLKLALVLSALIDMAIGVYLIRYQAQTKQDFKIAGMAVFSVLIATALAMQVRFDPLKLASGVFRHGEASLGDDTKIAYYKDGKTASISAAYFSGSQTMNIATNGKPDAGVSMNPNNPPAPDESTMILASALPLSFHSNPDNIGVIGFGSGMTTHTFLGDSRVKKVDTIEIEEAMVEGAKVFGQRVERAYHDPRSHIIIDDAKSYFSGQKTKYDIIVSEPSNPWISGIGSLFATEFYEFIPRHLNDNGLFVQWIQLYEINDRLVSSILKGLTTNFADYKAYVIHSDLIIVASPKAKLPKESDVIFQGVLKQELSYQGIDSLKELTAYRVADNQILRAYANLHDTRINSYYYPYLSMEAPKTRFQNSVANLLSADLPLGKNMLLEGLDVRSPADEYDYLLSKDNLANLDQLNKRAWLLSKYLNNEGFVDTYKDSLDYQAQRYTAILNSVGRDICNAPRSAITQKQLADGLLELADVTLPFLSAKAQEGVLINPKWLSCQPAEISPEAQQVFVFLDALAGRDWGKSAKIAETWLKQSPQDLVWRVFDNWMLNTVLINHARNNEWQKLVEAEQRLGKIQNPDDTLVVPLLLSLADVQTSQK